MQTNEYQLAAARTETDQGRAGSRIVNIEHDGSCDVTPVRLLHGAIGAMGDMGEVASCLEKWLWYGQDLDETNLKEEMGDVLWYFALICNALDWQLSDVMAANIEKLKRRFPEKYTDHDAAEENRDRGAEREALENARTAMHEMLPGDPLRTEFAEIVQQGQSVEHDEAMEESRDCSACGAAYNAYQDQDSMPTLCPTCLGRATSGGEDEPDQRWLERRAYLISNPSHAAFFDLVRLGRDFLQDMAAGELVATPSRARAAQPMCPHCSTWINDETMKRLIAGRITEGGCPNCQKTFTLDQVRPTHGSRVQDQKGL